MFWVFRRVCPSLADEPVTFGTDAHRQDDKGARRSADVKPSRLTRVMMTYALITLWHERQRFLPGVLAVAFSALLVALQCGLLLGIFTFASLPVDHAPAEIWLGGRNVQSVDLIRPIPETYVAYLTEQPEIAQCEAYVQDSSNWVRPDGGVEPCMIVGARLEETSLGAMRELTPELRTLLTEPDTVVIDASELGRLGVQRIGDFGQIGDHKVRVVGIVSGFRAVAGAYVFCSLGTARTLLHIRPTQVAYLLARCHDSADAPAVVERLRADYPELSIYTSDDFSLRSRLYWLLKTKAGIALGYAAALGLLVGAAVTSQTLYAATAASLREYAVLWALGIPRSRMAMQVVQLSLLVGVFGVALSLPLVFALAHVADWIGVTVLLPAWLLVAMAGITLTMALASGLLALRLLRTLEPAMLLR
jgi:putative ABC transport system permease protein